MDLDAEISRRAVAAAAAMEAASGGESLCSISRTGRRIPGVKYPEGRWAAMRELQRGLRRDPDRDPASVALDLLAVWEGDLAVRIEGEQGSWIDYRTGGCDALTEIAEMLGGSTN